MPYKTEFQFAELFLEHNGVEVYHTYDDNDIEQGENTYLFVTASHLELENAFNVQELSTWVKPVHPPFLTGDNNTKENAAAWEKYHAEDINGKAIKAAIIAAIDKGEITAYVEGEEDQENDRPETGDPLEGVNEVA